MSSWQLGATSDLLRRQEFRLHDLRSQGHFFGSRMLFKPKGKLARRGALHRTFALRFRFWRLFSVIAKRRTCKHPTDAADFSLETLGEFDSLLS